MVSPQLIHNKTLPGMIEKWFLSPGFFEDSLDRYELVFVKLFFEPSKQFFSWKEKHVKNFHNQGGMLYCVFCVGCIRRSQYVHDRDGPRVAQNEYRQHYHCQLC